MINTSTAYKTEVAKPNRTTYATIAFGVFDVQAREDATPSVNTQASFTDINSVVDDKRVRDYKPMTFEDDYPRLDGSFVLFPDSPAPNGTEIGWWSATQSDANREFDVDPIITINFSSLVTTLGISIVFDLLGGSYITDFKVQWYNGVTLLDEVNVIGNTETFASVDNLVEDYNKLVIALYKTDKPYRYARILEVNFGLEELFTNDLLISAELIEESSPVTKELSINKIKFTVINEDQKFNMINPDGIYSFLQKKQPITAYSGLKVGDEIEYIDLGIYYLSNWKNSSGLTSTVEAQDIFGILSKTTYYNSPFFVDEPLIDVLESLLLDAGITTFTITIEDGITELVNGYIPIVSHREAFQLVLLASRCAIRYDRQYGIEIYRADYSTSLKDIDYDTILGEPQIEQLQLITSVEATQNIYALSAASETIHESSFEVIGEKEVVITYDKVPAAEVSINITGSGSIVGTPVYSATCVILTIDGTGIVNAEVTGKPYLVSKKVINSVLDTIPTGEAPQSAELQANTLFTENTQDVTDYVLAYYQKRVKQRIEFLADPSLQAGDNITAETMFNLTKSGVIESQTITFTPSLRTSMEVVG